MSAPDVATGAAVESPVELTARQFRDVIGHFASGVTVITTAWQDKPFGTTASAVSSLSAEPPMVLICMNRTSSTGQAIAAGRRFAINILSEGQGDLAQRFATKDPEKLSSTPTLASASGLPLLADALAYLECRVVEEVVGGTHVVFLARVTSATAREGAPLAYFRGRFGRIELAEDVAGLVVPPITPAMLEDALAACAAIELGVVRRTVGRVPRERLGPLEARSAATVQLLGEEGRQVDTALALNADREFHEAHVRLAGSERLLASYRRLALTGMHLRTFRPHVTTRADVAFAGDHRELLDAYYANDVERACAVVERHVERTRRAYEHALERGRDPNQPTGR